MRNRCDTLRYRTLRNGRVAGFNLTLRHLLLHPSAEIQRVGVAAIDVAGVVDRDGFEAVDLDGLQDEGHDLSVLVEDLNAVVGTVGDEQPAGRIHRQAMRRVELTGPGAFLAPLLDVLAV